MLIVFTALSIYSVAGSPVCVVWYLWEHMEQSLTGDLLGACVGMLVPSSYVCVWVVCEHRNQSE